MYCSLLGSFVNRMQAGCQNNVNFGNSSAHNVIKLSRTRLT